MTAVLSMIVKNEAKTVERCLMSLRPCIDAYMIVDTGSTDNTQNIIREAMYGIPGEVQDRPWQDFATNRNEALELARPWADYVVFADADMELKTEDQDVFRRLTDPVYNMRQVLGEQSFTFYNTRVLRSDCPARYVGVLHEYLELRTAVSKLDTAYWFNHHDGVRSTYHDKYQRDAEVLAKALKADPTNCRYAYYLAQSLRDAGELDRAAAMYRQRAGMLNGFIEETWSAMYECGKLQERIGQNPRNSYLSAFQYRPTRAEPLFQLARYHRERQEFHLAYMFAKHGLTIPYPSDLLFVEADIYQWKLLDELGIAAYYTGHPSEGREALASLLVNEAVPAQQLERIEKNLAFYG